MMALAPRPETSRHINGSLSERERIVIPFSTLRVRVMM